MLLRVATVPPSAPTVGPGPPSILVLASLLPRVRSSPFLLVLVDAPSRFAEFAPVSSKISTASHGPVPAQSDVPGVRAGLADRLGYLCNGLKARDAVVGPAFVRWSRDRENDQQTCDVALDVLLGELGGAGDATFLEPWPVACAQIGRDHLMLHNLSKPIGKNSRAARARSPSGGASGGVFLSLLAATASKPCRELSSF